ncbi:MAG: nuclear transport factor 2 family protein [Alphaproteobacteria bacterium]
MSENFPDLLDRFTAAVEAGDGAALAALFTADGTYDDTFYGLFRGPDAISDMLENRFWGDAEAFLWDMFEPVFDTDSQIGYARWVFSYMSVMEDSAGRRVAFEGMSQFQIRDGLIAQYREVFSAGIALAQLEMAPERIWKILNRQFVALSANPEWTKHLKP